MRERRITNIVLHGPRPREEMPAINASADATASGPPEERHVSDGLSQQGVRRDGLRSADRLGHRRGGPRPGRAGGAGYYAEPENPEALAAAIRRLHADPAEAEAMGRRGRAYVSEHFDRQQLAVRYLAELESIARA